MLHRLVPTAERSEGFFSRLTFPLATLLARKCRLVEPCAIRVESPDFLNTGVGLFCAWLVPRKPTKTHWNELKTLYIV